VVSKYCYVMVCLRNNQANVVVGGGALVIISDSLIMIQVGTIINKNFEHNQFLQPI
jgi:hypothetical protein